MSAEVKDRIIFLKDVLGSVSVMDIIVYDENLFVSSFLGIPSPGTLQIHPKL